MDLIVVNVFLSALPPQQQGFSVPLYIVTVTGNSLDGDTVRTYTSPADAEADLTAGFITTAVRDALVAGFTQTPRIDEIKVATAAVGAYDDAYNAALAADSGFYAVVADTVLAADILELATVIEASGSTNTPAIYLAQSNDADWLTTGLPAALTGLAGMERTAVLYHPTATEPAALAWACARLSADPDNQSAPFSGRLRGIQAYPTPLTGAQVGFARDTNFANVLTPFGTAPVHLLKGTNISGRPLYEILSADWFRARVREDFIQRRLEFDDRQEKILVDATGQALGLGIIGGRLRQGELAQHYTPGQTRATAEDITADDLSNGRLRWRAEAQIGVNALEFVVNLYQTTNPLVEA